MTPTTEPNTRAPAVVAVATAVRVLGGCPYPVPDGRPQLAALSRPRISVIDFYPATPSTNHQGATHAV